MSLSKLFARRQKAEALPPEELARHMGAYMSIVKAIETEATPIHLIASAGMRTYAKGIVGDAATTVDWVKLDNEMWSALEAGDWDELAAVCRSVTG